MSKSDLSETSRIVLGSDLNQFTLGEIQARDAELQENLVMLTDAELALAAQISAYLVRKDVVSFG